MLEQHTLSSVMDSTAPKLILIVEDDIEFGSALVHMIREETPYQAILATSGIEALNIVVHLKCDLFLLDYLLPSMNGLELYDRLHATKGNEETPAFFLSASSRLPQQEMEKRNLKSFTKLIELDDLLGTIRGFVEVERK